MAQELIDRIREAERKGDELEKQAAADAAACVRDANTQAGEQIRRAGGEAEAEGRHRMELAAEEGESIKAAAAGRRRNGRQNCAPSRQPMAEAGGAGFQTAAGLRINVAKEW